MINEILYLPLSGFSAFLIPFLILLILEFIIVYLFFRKNHSLYNILLLVLLINLFTWPLANSLFAMFKTVLFLIILEILIITTEAIFIKFILKTNYKKAFIVSFLANIASFVIGSILLILIFFI
ncbi:MAG: hypothetical protein ACMXX8_01600 [Candidatus Woesearchaeota archaeon]